MVESIRRFKKILDSEITFGIEGCDFRVEQTEDPDVKKVRTQVIIEMPNLHPENRKKQPRVTRAFTVEAGEVLALPVKSH